MKRFGVATAGLLLLAASSSATAQELVHTFKSPGFGGNPFNADYLLGVATAQRPERGGDADDELTETELFARQIQSRLLSSLSSGIVEAITGAEPGTTGEFTVGDQTIFFERTLTEIRLVITNNQTGETTEIVVPVLDLNPGGSGNPVGQAAASPVPIPGAPGPITGMSSIFAPTPLEGAPIEGGDLTSNPLGK